MERLQPKAAVLVFSLLWLLLPVCGDGPLRVGPLGDLPGNWAWIHSYGGIAGQDIYADSVDYTKTVNIGINSNYTEFVDDSVYCHQSFQLIEKVVWDRTALVMIIENYPFELVIERVDRDTLVLNQYCEDCFRHTYIRLHPI